MQIGKLRHRIKLQRLAETRDVHGGLVRQHNTFATVWARVKPLRGQELLHAQQVESRTTHEVRIRQRDDVTATDRLVHLDRDFNVLSFMDTNERHRETVFNCVEVND